MYKGQEPTIYKQDIDSNVSQQYIKVVNFGSTVYPNSHEHLRHF